MATSTTVTRSPWNAPNVTRVIEVATGKPGVTGPSAYQLAVAQGFEGTLDEWLASLVGPPGDVTEEGLREIAEEVASQKVEGLASQESLDQQGQSFNEALTSQGQAFGQALDAQGQQIGEALGAQGERIDRLEQGGPIEVTITALAVSRALGAQVPFYNEPQNAALYFFF